MERCRFIGWIIHYKNSNQMKKVNGLKIVMFIIISLVIYFTVRILVFHLEPLSNVKI